MKHIDIWHHFIQELMEEKIISLEYVATEDPLVDILTKALDSKKIWIPSKCNGNVLDLNTAIKLP